MKTTKVHNNHVPAVKPPKQPPVIVPPVVPTPITVSPVQAKPSINITINIIEQQANMSQEKRDHKFHRNCTERGTNHYLRQIEEGKRRAEELLVNMLV